MVCLALGCGDRDRVLTLLGGVFGTLPGLRFAMGDRGDGIADDVAPVPSALEGLDAPALPSTATPCPAAPWRSRAGGGEAGGLGLRIGLGLGFGGVGVGCGGIGGKGCGRGGA
eukprot:13925027-Alexandrium_andersonii.AAC.1